MSRDWGRGLARGGMLLFVLFNAAALYYATIQPTAVLVSVLKQLESIASLVIRCFWPDSQEQADVDERKSYFL
jgi:hypothetical protein